MRKILLCAAIVLYALSSSAQKATTTWSDEFKMKKGSTDLAVVHTDKTGVYVQEGHVALKSYFVIGATLRESATLVKLNKSFSEEYRNDFNKELKGKEFEDFYFIQNKAYILATSYDKKDRTLHIHAAEINKSDGTLKNEWKELTSISADEKNSKLNVNFSYNADSTKMILVSTDFGKSNYSFAVDEFDVNMKRIGKTTIISNSFEAKTFQLEDVIYTLDGNIVMVGRVYAYEEGKKKKNKFLDFKNYNIQLFTNDGKLIKEINTTIDAKWLVSSKVAQIPNKDLILAAFYSNEKKAKEINGILVQRINPATGDVISTSNKEINTAMISTATNDDSDEEESKEERKEREKFEKLKAEEEGFSKYLRFRNFIYTEDGGIIILAEKYNNYQYTTTSYTGGGAGGMRMTTRTYDVYECGDMMMSKMNADGQLSWLNVLPKNQVEIFTTGSSTNSGIGLSFTMGVNYFSKYSRPFYAGLGSLAIPDKNMMAIIFNDGEKNRDVLQLGQKVSKTQRFSKSICYVLYLDASTGKYTRKELFSNSDQPVAMPRLGAAIGKDYYMVGKEDRIFGKTKIAVGKISFK